MHVPTIAALKALIGAGHVDVLGYYAPGDGGGGQFYFDAASSAADDTGMVIAPSSGTGRWLRMRTNSAVSVDWFAAPGGDYTAAFIYASAYQNVVCSQKSYLMNAAITLKEGQVWNLNGAVIYHTDDTKPMFTATGLSTGGLIGPGTLKGTLTTSAGPWNGEKGVVLNGCNGYRAHALDTRLFMGQGFHIIPGTFAGFKADQNRITDCGAFECQSGLQIDNGSGAEYNGIMGFNAVGNITGTQIGAGNNVFTGGNIVQNRDGVVLLGGGNNGHGMFTGTNINHNGRYNIFADDVGYGYTFTGCHIYGDSPTQGLIKLQNGTTDILIHGGVVDARIENDSGTNRVVNNKTYAQFAVAGSNAAGLLQSGNF